MLIHQDKMLGMMQYALDTGAMDAQLSSKHSISPMQTLISFKQTHRHMIGRGHDPGIPMSCHISSCRFSTFAKHMFMCTASQSLNLGSQGP